MSMGQLMTGNWGQRSGNRSQSGLGLEVQQFKSAISSSLMTAAAADPEPFSKVGLTIAALFTKIFGFGYDPKKLNDTAVTESVQIGLHSLWNDLTGDNLPVNCTPGQCGKQHVAIFEGSNYPAVPYPAGRPGMDVNQVIAATQQLIAQGRQQLVRPESVSAYEFNTQYMLGLFNQVAQAQAMQNPLSSAYAQGQALVAGQSGITALLPWFLGGYAIYRFVL